MKCQRWMARLQGHAASSIRDVVASSKGPAHISASLFLVPLVVTLVSGCHGLVVPEPGVAPAREPSTPPPTGGKPPAVPSPTADAGPADTLPPPAPPTVVDAKEDVSVPSADTSPVPTPDAGTPLDLRERDLGSPDTSPPPSAACVRGLPPELSDLKALVTASTATPITPMGTNYVAAAMKTPSAADLAFLSNPGAQPVIPPSTMGLRWQMFPVTLYPSGNPLPADVNQHAIGDCNALAAFVDMAYQNPAFVRQLITDNGDGTYAVAMYDPKGRPMKVALDRMFLADGSNKIGAVTGKNGVATWATVLEKAVMKYIQVYKIREEIGGIGSEHTSPMFTGEGGSFAFDRGRLSPTELNRVVKSALAAGKLITGGFGKIRPMGNVNTVTAHAYSVMLPPNENVMVAMRNPWGVNPMANGFDTTTDGVINVPATKYWSDDIDLRIIDPGAACKIAQPVAYEPTPAQIYTTDIRIVEQPGSRLAPRTKQLR
ncbi:MAG TPA: C2 family cysteine protease [Polyangia bacterium]